MLILGNFLLAIIPIVRLFFWALEWLIIIRCIISWVNADMYNPVVMFVHRATEPILAPIRRLFPPMRVDFSPIIAFLAILFLKTFLISSLYDIGTQLKYKDQFRNTSPRIQIQEPQGQPPSELEEALPSDKLFN